MIRNLLRLSLFQATGLSWLLLGWIAQLLLPLVHQRWMAERSGDAGSAAFCGLVSSRVVAGFAALAPAELKAAMRRASRHSPDASCELCASVHAPTAYRSLPYPTGLVMCLARGCPPRARFDAFPTPRKP
ncbi:hypothetical protein [Hydrocarboniphaga sp.]|uniref:hypothetical protein n=1 Tax=Hydrocarboniphaga sp. TaxID=2033016 RepID=UPI002602F712|nr:hypothetical protein [Hydrocarboniphaga sp.]